MSPSTAACRSLPHTLLGLCRSCCSGQQLLLPVRMLSVVLLGGVGGRFCLTLQSQEQKIVTAWMPEVLPTRY